MVEHIEESDHHSALEHVWDYRYLLFHDPERAGIKNTTMCISKMTTAIKQQLCKHGCISPNSYFEICKDSRGWETDPALPECEPGDEKVTLREEEGKRKRRLCL